MTDGVTPGIPWGAYLGTHLYVENLPVLEWRPETRPIHVVTAWNPMSRIIDEAENRRRQAALVAAVDEMGLEWFAAEGRSPAGPHTEESVALVGATVVRVIDLGRRFEQAAIFEVTLTDLRVVSCIDDQQMSRPLV